MFEAAFDTGWLVGSDVSVVGVRGDSDCAFFMTIERYLALAEVAKLSGGSGALSVRLLEDGTNWTRLRFIPAPKYR